MHLIDINCKVKDLNISSLFEFYHFSLEFIKKFYSFQQQLNDLDSRLGKGVGAVKQRKRIQYAIDHQQVENQKKGKSKKSKKRTNVKNS